MKRPLLAFICLTVIPLLMPAAAAAQERLCDTQYEDCREPLLELIRNEQVRIDVAFWFMEDSRYVAELIRAKNRGVPVRVLVDQRANASKRLNETILNELRDGGIPMRDKFVGDILHFKMMLFHGQKMLEFSKANYAPGAFVPIVPNVNYDDEAIFFTNDVNLLNSFKRRFDDLWVNTTQYRNFANVSGTLVRVCPSCTIHPSMNFVPLENYSDRAVSRYDAEPNGIDAIVFRVTDFRQPDAMLRAVQRGVTVRVISEPTEYRNPTRLYDAKHIDRMYMGGVQIKMRQHEGLMHEAAVVMHGLGEVIFGSSNWTTASAAYEDEHNYFYDPSLNKPWFYQWFSDQFNRKWNDTVNYVPFEPLPPDSPVYSSPSNGASGAGTSVTLTWDGGPWSHLYDIYFGTSPNPPLIQSNKELGSPDAGQQETFTINNLLPGTTYYWRIVDKTWAQKTNSGPVWSFTTAGTPPGGGDPNPPANTPFGGNPAAIPGTFQAENFDEGGQSIAYFDTTGGNSGSAYRATDVDLEASADTGGGFNLMKTRAGEWLKYTVNISTSGTYTFEARVASLGGGGTFHVEVDGVNKTGTMTVPNTGGWQTWQTVSKTGIALTAGTHVVRISLDSIGPSGGVGNYNWFRFTSSGTPPPPTSPAYGGTPAPVPGVFQAENFDEGGQSVAYSDTTGGNSGGVYRVTDVDLEATTDTGGGFNVMKTRAGEWLTYSVNVTTAGTYTFQARVASLGGGGTFHVEVDGVNKTGTLTVPNTGGWQTWQTISKTGIALTAGTHVIRVSLDTVGPSGGVGNYNWFRFQ
jgi:hypothetical protein